MARYRIEYWDERSENSWMVCKIYLAGQVSSVGTLLLTFKELKQMASDLGAEIVALGEGGK